MLFNFHPLKALSTYLQERERDLLTLLNKASATYTSDTFHKLRLEIKKQNAFFELLEGCDKKFERSKLFGPLKIIFRQAGHVRDLQIEATLLNTYFPGKELLEYKGRIKRRIELEKKKFFNLFTPKLNSEISHLYASSNVIVPVLSKKKVAHFFKSRRHKIKELAGQTQLTVDQTHELRKRLKKYNYNLDALPAKNRIKEKTAISKTLPDILGKWHDCHFVIVNLRKALRSKGLRPIERKHIIEIISQLSEKRKMLLLQIKEIVTATGKLFN